MLIHDRDLLLAIGEENPNLSATDLLDAWEQAKAAQDLDDSSALFVIYAGLTSDPLGILDAEIELDGWNGRFPIERFRFLLKKNPNSSCRDIVYQCP